MPVLSNFKGSWWAQTKLEIGPFKAWWNGGDSNAHLIRNSFLAAEWRERRLLLIRFGTPRWKGFAERHQGQPGYPKRWHYLFGQRISIKWGPNP